MLIAAIMHQRCMLYTSQRALVKCCHSLNSSPMKIHSTLAAFTAAVFAFYLPSPIALATQAVQARTDATKKVADGRKKIVAKKRAKQLALAETEAPEFTNFLQWRAVTEFIDQTSAEYGFDRDELQSLFRRAQYLDSVVKLINPPRPGKTKNWTAYHDRFIEPRRVKAGIEFWDRYEPVLQKAQDEFGVPAETIVGILGVETIYGQSTGKFRVPDVLVTLAFAYPDTPNREARMAYFRDELTQTLLYARESGIDPFSLSGSYAGAIGWPQFMPGSVRKFAVDFDGDGKIDLRNSPQDAIGSVANFLAKHGWTAGQPLVYRVQVTPDKGWPRLIGQGLEAKFSRTQMEEAGVIVPGDVPMALTYGLIDLEDDERPVQYWLATDNFFAITQYNRSYYYAMAVIELGREVNRQRISR